MKAKIEAKMMAWRSTLILQAKCTPEQASTLITQLKKRFWPFPDEAINTLMKNPRFLDRVSAYNRYGIKATLHWLHHCTDFTHLSSLAVDAVADQPVRAMDSESKPVHVNIYGRLTSLKTQQRKELRRAATEVARRICRHPKTPNTTLINYLFAQLAQKIDHALNTEQNQARAMDMYQELTKGVVSEQNDALFKQILSNAADRILNELQTKPVMHLGLDVQLDDPYTFSTRDTFSIWFSNNPKKAMPENHKTILAERAKLLAPGETRLVYSSSCLEQGIAEEFEAWANSHGIHLIDFEQLYLELDGEDRALADLAQLELSRMREHTGGNPAAASDLVRWMSILSEQPCVYVDVDMPLIDKDLKEATLKSGHPILLNMGSVLLKQGDQLPLEIIAFNTDILSFSTLNPERLAVTKKITSSLIANYQDCAAVLTTTKDPALIALRITPGYQHLLANAPEALDLPRLRHAVIQAHANVMAYAQFLGAACFCERYAEGQEQGLIEEAITQVNEDALTQILLKRVRLKFTEETMDEKAIVQAELNTQAAHIYKSLVMEFSGPSAVTAVIMDNQADEPPRQFPELNDAYLASPLRILQYHACCMGKTNFRSSNIPAWEMHKEDSDVQQNERQEGLSWMPNEQNKLAR